MEELFALTNQLINFTNLGLGLAEQAIRTLPEIPGYILNTYSPKTSGVLRGTGATKTIYHASKSLANLTANTIREIRKNNNRLKIPLESRELLRYH